MTTPQDWINLSVAVSELAIEEKIDFVSTKINSTGIPGSFEFKVLEYPADYILDCLRKIDVDNEMFLFYKQEYEIYFILERLEESVVLNQNLLKELFVFCGDYYHNARYRFGLEGEEKYSIWQAAPSLDYYTYQKIRNCTEISHRLEKEKRMQKKI